MRTFKLLLLMAMVAALAVAVHADTIISTNPVSETGIVSPTVPVGESISVGSDNILETVTFYPVNNSGVMQTGSVWVYDFNGSDGPTTPLYHSGDMNIPTGESPVTWNMGNLALVSGNQYAIVFTTNGAAIDYMFDSNDYSGGHFVWAFTDGSGNLVPGWNSGSNWFNYDDFEVGMEARLTNGSNQVPEPASMVLLGTGLLGAAQRIRRKLLA